MASEIKVNKITPKADPGGLTISLTPTAPVSPATGEMYYDTISNTLKIYNGTAWFNLDMTDPTIFATGGTVTSTTIGGVDYRLHAYLTSSIFVVTKAMNIDILVVAGGGAGGYANFSAQDGRAGAGGAGGLIYITNFPVTVGTYTVTRGAGGTGWNNNDEYGDNGSNSVFTGNSRTLTALGGGGGGEGTNSSSTGQTGGSGGGGWYNTNGEAATQPVNTSDGISTYNTTGWGYAGGNGATSHPHPGGGGGAGAAGADSGSGATGGAGKDYSSIFGTTYGESGWFAGGGGGAGYGGWSTPPYTEHAGGQGGGGHGSNKSQQSTANGDANTGGGGGSGHLGGSGIVVIRYAI